MKDFVLRIHQNYTDSVLEMNMSADDMAIVERFGYAIADKMGTAEVLLEGEDEPITANFFPSVDEVKDDDDPNLVQTN